MSDAAVTGRLIETEADLDALPDGAVIRGEDYYNSVFQKAQGSWLLAGVSVSDSEVADYLPALLLWPLPDLHEIKKAVAEYVRLDKADAAEIANYLRGAR